MFWAARALQWRVQQAIPAPTGVGNLIKAVLKGDWGLQMCPMNEEFPVGAIHQIAPI